jgi:hypothetical protein
MSIKHALLLGLVAALPMVTGCVTQAQQNAWSNCRSEAAENYAENHSLPSMDYSAPWHEEFAKWKRAVAVYVGAETSAVAECDRLPNYFH